MRRTIALLVVTWLLCCIPAHAKIGWNPAHTWVFAVGILEFKDKSSYMSFPKERRRDERLVSLLKKDGVPADHIVFIEDAAATRSTLTQKFTQLLDRTKSGDMLIVYYAGHGTRNKQRITCFVPYDADGKNDDTCWSLNAIVDTIESHFKGDRVLLTADSCYSGGAAQVAAAHRGGRISYAVLTSSQASSASTGAWTFTEALLDGLSGSPLADLDHNGQVTLGELGTYVESEMAFGDQQLSTFAAGKLGKDLVLADVAGKAPSGRVGERLEVQQEGRWWRGKIIEQRPNGFKIHYYGWDESWDEWVTPDRMRPLVAKTYPVGAKISVEWHRQWYPATVMKVYRGVHYIHYDGEDTVWDEWVGNPRIKQRS